MKFNERHAKIFFGLMIFASVSVIALSVKIFYFENEEIKQSLEDRGTESFYRKGDVFIANEDYEIRQNFPPEFKRGTRIMYEIEKTELIWLGYCYFLNSGKIVIDKVENNVLYAIYDNYTLPLPSDGYCPSGIYLKIEFFELPKMTDIYGKTK